MLLPIVIWMLLDAFWVLDVFLRPTLRGCQSRGTLGRVKPLRLLTLPCQKTNPDGVICGGIGWQWEVRINIRNYGIVIVRFYGIFCRLKEVRFVWND